LEAVTVYVVAAGGFVADAVAEGVPIIKPVSVSIVRPAGRVGLTLYEVTAPPVLVGVFEAIFTPVA
jgi:hypothetical protein